MQNHEINPSRLGRSHKNPSLLTGRKRLYSLLVSTLTTVGFLIGLIFVIIDLSSDKNIRSEENKGPRGPVGPVGYKGLRGSQGLKGIKGKRGPIGLSDYRVKLSKAELTDVFETLSFTLNQNKPFYISVDIWEENPSLIQETYKNLHEAEDLTSLGEFIEELKKFGEDLAKTNKTKDFNSIFAEQIALQFSHDEKIKNFISDLIRRFSKTRKIDILRLFYSDFFFGRYFRNKNLLMKKLKDEYLPIVKNSKDGILYEKYKENFKLIANFMKIIYEDIWLNFEDKGKLENSIKNSNEQEIEKLIDCLAGYYFNAIINYHYLYYVAFFFKLEKKGKYMFPAVTEDFENIFRRINYAKWKKNLKEINKHIGSLNVEIEKWRNCADTVLKKN